MSQTTKPQPLETPPQPQLTNQANLKSRKEETSEKRTHREKERERSREKEYKKHKHRYHDRSESYEKRRKDKRRDTRDDEDEQRRERHSRGHRHGRERDSRRDEKREFKSRGQRSRKRSEQRDQKKERPKVPTSIKREKTQEQKMVEKLPQEQKKTPIAQSIVTRGGGVYIPPHKLARMQHNIEKQGPQSVAYQKYMFENLRKSINGIVNKVNTNNIQNVLFELFNENLLRGKGLLCRAVMKAQMASPNFSHVYSALIAVVNTKLPDIARLLINSVLNSFQKSYKSNIKVVCQATTKMIAHLVNQQVLNELIALQILVLFLEDPTQDSVEMAAQFMKECGQVLSDLTPAGVNSIFERFRGILHEGEIDKRVQYTIENLFAVRKSKFKDYPGVIPQLDLVEEDDKITHTVSLDDEKFETQVELDLFHFDKEWEKNEQEWNEIRKEILGEEEISATKRQAKLAALQAEGEEQIGGEAALMIEEAEEEDQEGGPQLQHIEDLTEQDLKNLRRVIYLTIMSSIEFEACAHKLLKLNLREGQQIELCNMIMECCMQERTYLRFYGLLAQRFCVLDEKYQILFEEECFPAQYNTIHRLETNMVRNLAKFFAHLLYTEAIHWKVWKFVKLTEEDTTAAGRIFIKIVWQEMSGLFGLKQLKEKVDDEEVKPCLEGLFPRDSLSNVRFSINFFTSIELGLLTEAQRDFLEEWPKMLMQRKIEKLKAQMEQNLALSSSDSGSDSSEDSSGSSDSDSGSDSSNSEQ